MKSFLSIFFSLGADGSVRMFDLRHLEHSTIIYEDPQHTPLLRLAWNKQDPNYLATVAMDACEVSKFSLLLELLKLNLNCVSLSFDDFFQVHCLLTLLLLLFMINMQNKPLNYVSCGNFACKFKASPYVNIFFFTFYTFFCKGCVNVNLNF